MKADWFRACAIKRAYATEAEATEPGSRVYLCFWCGRWHRTGLAKSKSAHGRQMRSAAVYERHLKRLGRAKA